MTETAEAPAASESATILADAPAATPDAPASAQTTEATQPQTPVEQPQATEQSHAEWIAKILNPDGKFRPGWVDAMGDDFAPDRAMLDSMPTIQDLVKSYAATKRMVGKKLEPPGPDAPSEQVSAWRKTIGVPDSPEGYEIKPPENLEGVQFDEKLAGEFSTLAHELNIPKTAAQKLVAWQLEKEAALVAKAEEAQAEADKVTLQEQTRVLREKWGDKFDGNINAARNAVKHLAQQAGVEVDISTHPAFADANIVALFSTIGRRMTEDPGLSTTSNTFEPPMTEAQWAMDVQTNPKNPYYPQYHSPNPPEWLVNRMRAARSKPR